MPVSRARPPGARRSSAAATSTTMRGRSPERDGSVHSARRRGACARREPASSSITQVALGRLEALESVEAQSSPALERAPPGCLAHQLGSLASRCRRTSRRGFSSASASSAGASGPATSSGRRAVRAQQPAEVATLDRTSPDRGRGIGSTRRRPAPSGGASRRAPSRYAASRSGTLIGRSASGPGLPSASSRIAPVRRSGASWSKQREDRGARLVPGPRGVERPAAGSRACASRRRGDRRTAGRTGGSAREPRRARARRHRPAAGGAAGCPADPVIEILDRRRLRERAAARSSEMYRPRNGSAGFRSVASTALDRASDPRIDFGRSARDRRPA